MGMEAKEVSFVFECLAPQSVIEISDDTSDAPDDRPRIEGTDIPIAHFFDLKRHDGWVSNWIIEGFLTLIFKNHPESVFLDPIRLNEKETAEQWANHFSSNEVFKPSRKSIFIPINIHFHWILVYVDLVETTIHYYDSLQGRQYIEEVNKKIPNFLDILLNVQTIQYDKMGPGFSFTLFFERDHRNDGSPRQSNNNDCGVHVCMAAYRLVNNLPLLDINDDSIEFFRQEIARALRQGSLDGIEI